MRDVNLLLAEDDAILADALRTNLDRAGFGVVWAADGVTAEAHLLGASFDAAVIDIGLPQRDGLTVLKNVRKARPRLPLLILTALDGLEDRVAGLNAGADDYLTKPFDFPELEARLHAVLRRTRAPDQPAGAPLQVGVLRLEQAARQASIGDQRLELSPREWLLLELLAGQCNRVVTKDRIAEAWQVDATESGGPSSLEVYIHRLRRKLDGAGLAIRTVRGLGYLLEADPS